MAVAPYPYRRKVVGVVRFVKPEMVIVFPVVRLAAIPVLPSLVLAGSQVTVAW